MAEFVLDASVAVSWCFPGDPAENTAYSRRILSMLTTEEAVVPEIWAFEIANVLFVACNKRKRITEQQINEYLHRLKKLPIRLERNELWVNVDLQARARKWDLPAYDAAYLDLAMRRNIPIATTDDDLKRIAEREGLKVLV
jgi:predicted nucleic acid-binding protein